VPRGALRCARQREQGVAVGRVGLVLALRQILQPLLPDVLQVARRRLLPRSVDVACVAQTLARRQVVGCDLEHRAPHSIPLDEELLLVAQGREPIQQIPAFSAIHAAKDHVAFRDILNNVGIDKISL